MESTIIKRSVLLVGHKTSVSLEDEFWNGLKEIAAVRKITLSGLIVSIDHARNQNNLSSALRLSVLEFYRDQVERRGSDRAAA
jgi:predicted DNA-binding ribbon-helix-helix protein